MKNLLLSLPFFFCSLSFATIFTTTLSFSSANLSTSFAGSNAHVVWDGGATPVAIDTIMVDNLQGTGLKVNCCVTGAAVPSDSGSCQMPVAGNEAWTPPDKAGFGNQCYLKSQSGTISSGSAAVVAIGR